MREALVVGTASAFGTVRDLFGNGKPHVARTYFSSEGKRGSFTVRLLSIRAGVGEHEQRWSIVPETDREAPTGQYVQVSGHGRILRIGGHAQAWNAQASWDS